jgi:NADH:ubiquinone oxidoreductase subunit
MATTLGTWINTKLTGRYVGKDQFGNRYYEARKKNSFNHRKRRWVIYKGKAEPSKVPPEWHNWLHYTSQTAPTTPPKGHAWQAPHRPNVTGTKDRYLPEGHISKSGARAKSSADYTPWSPDNA